MRKKQPIHSRIFHPVKTKTQIRKVFLVAGVLLVIPGFLFFTGSKTNKILHDDVLLSGSDKPLFGTVSAEITSEDNIVRCKNEIYRVGKYGEKKQPLVSEILEKGPKKDLFTVTEANEKGLIIYRFQGLVSTEGNGNDQNARATRLDRACRIVTEGGKLTAENFLSQPK